MHQTVTIELDDSELVSTHAALKAHLDYLEKRKLTPANAMLRQSSMTAKLKIEESTPAALRDLLGLDPVDESEE
jgi:hypothetical protein